jgi:hypothetical protein
MSAAEQPVPFGQTRFVLAPHASIELGTSRLVWPMGGTPAVLDPASAAMLDCFTEPLSPRELADDLVDAIGLDHDTALRSAVDTAYALRMGGHLIAADQVPMPSWRLDYPPSSSP